MRTLLMVFAVCVIASCAMPVQACEDCDSYFEPRSLEWCDYCKETHCGYFNCFIKYYEGLGYEYCTGDDPGCFTPGKSCPREPRYETSLPRLNERWRLSRVRVSKTTGDGSEQTSGASPITTVKG